MSKPINGPEDIVDALRDLMQIASETGEDFAALLQRAGVRIEILHARDPDYECAHTVYVGGSEVSVDIESLDPGAGYIRAEWEEAATDAALPETGRSEAFRAALASTYAAMSGNKYITD